jgi:DHA2 family multidrug resistance protein-like MFS transporter
MIVFGAGLSVTLTVSTDTVVATAPKERAGAASAISETANELGGALGIAVLGSVLGAAYRGDLMLPSGLAGQDSDAVRESLGGALATAARLPGQLAGPVVDAAREAFVSAARLTMYGSAVLVLLLGASALFTLRGVPKVIEEPTEPGEGAGESEPEVARAGS